MKDRQTDGLPWTSSSCDASCSADLDGHGLGNRLAANDANMTCERCAQLAECGWL